MAKDAVARGTLFALRETIARLEGKPAPALAASAQERLTAGGADRPADFARRQENSPLATGAAALDEALEGGIRRDALTEIRSSALRDAGAATGFALGLAVRLMAHPGDGDVHGTPVLWISDKIAVLEAGRPHAVGLRDFGLEPESFLQASPRKLEDALWLAETALSGAAFTAVILEVRGNPARFGLTESRRLALRAKASGRPLLLLRQAGEEEASSAFHRLSIEPAPASARSLPDGSLFGGSIGNPAFRILLEKSRNPAPLSFVLEWNPHDRRFSPLPDRARPVLPKSRSAHTGALLSASADRPHRAQEVGAVLAFGDRAVARKA